MKPQWKSGGRVVVPMFSRNEVPRNSHNRPKHEPVHSNLLESYPFQTVGVHERLAKLALALEMYRDHPLEVRILLPSIQTVHDSNSEPDYHTETDLR
jgi:hypothetical protein